MDLLINKNILIHQKFTCCGKLECKTKMNNLFFNEENKLFDLSLNNVVSVQHVDSKTISNYIQIIQKGRNYQKLFKNQQQLLASTKINFFTPQNLDMIDEFELKSKFRLTKHQFTKQCTHIYDAMGLMIESLNKKTNYIPKDPNEQIILELYVYQLEKNVYVTQSKELIYKSLGILNFLCQNAFDITDAMIYFSLSRHMINRYLEMAIGMVKYFYISFFQSKKFWTETRLRSTILDEYRILFELCLLFFFVEISI